MKRDELNLIVPAEAAAKLEAYITRTEKQLSVVKQVMDSLIAEEGKVISAHVAKRLTKQFPSLKFAINSPYSWFNLDISGEGFDEINLQLCYKSEPKVISIKRITELNQRYLLDEERLPKYRAELVTLSDKVEAYNKAIFDLMEAQRAISEIKFAITDNNTIYGYAANGTPIWN